MVPLFFITASIAAVSTVMVITRRSAVHALLYLIVSLLSTAVIFFMLGAPFAGVLEIIVYAGAIMVLFVFVIMMLNLGKESVREETKLLGHGVWVLPAVLSVILLGELIYLLINSDLMSSAAAVVPAKTVGISLYGTYLACVELAGLVLMAGIIGAYHIGKSERRPLHRFISGKGDES